MNKIYEKKWKKFKLGDLFDLKNSKAYHTKDVEETDAGLHYITRSKFNNGLKSRVVKIDDYQINPAGTISFGAENANFFYQENEYITGNKMYYIDTRNISKYSALFLRCVLEETFTNNFSFSDGMIPDRIKDEYISLPQDSNEQPDWEYMESYMKNIMQESEENIENLQNISEHKNKIDIKNWQEFLLGGDDGLFNIVKGTRLTKANMKEGNINFIGSSAINNGVTNHISNSERVHPANLITVSYNGSIGEAFYQDEPFWASDDVNVFYPKFEQNFEIAMFLIPLIRKVGEKYKFVDKWKLEDMCNDKIKLPVNKNSEPNWEYMENYMKNIMQDTQSKLDKLVCC